jgi:hypothetical protein
MKCQAPSQNPRISALDSLHSLNWAVPGVSVGYHGNRVFPCITAMDGCSLGTEHHRSERDFTQPPPHPSVLIYGAFSKDFHLIQTLYSVITELLLKATLVSPTLSF